MSGPGTPDAAPAQPKQLSSRLLTMKFMQRAVASSPNQAGGAASQTAASNPSTKRRRLDTNSNAPTPSPLSRSTSQYSMRTSSKPGLDIQDGYQPNRIVREGDETQWVLDLNRIDPTSKQQQEPNGHHSLAQDDDYDNYEDDIWVGQAIGRQSYGSFSRKKPSVQPPTPSARTNEDDLSSLSDPDDSPHVSKLNAQHGSGTRKAIPQPATRPSQAPKRFFDQISASNSPDKNSTSPKKRNKNFKKPRITI